MRRVLVAGAALWLLTNLARLVEYHETFDQ